ncbi:nuclear protein Es2-domain-containing protein [Polychytrium aggregatum]|uniref:nuclear protein Es2-domain-containing protein n=1 Tax=Polychytrium aggregatum TaxID=110093 RepID=UPI0022FE3C4A|nr:nuclear protein Es2-domain-containing protein [Polychytrium aggregatum]KAI9193544.1 nuclear protein Es2-domain-containing protein [Polychytrium aggregatum]
MSEQPKELASTSAADPVSTAVVAAESQPQHLQPLPPAPPQAVLEEDVYVATVSEIIERDFFPHLKKMKLQNEFLGAINDEDYYKAKTVAFQLGKLTGDLKDEPSASTPAASSFTQNAAQTPTLKRFQTPVYTSATPKSSVDNAETATPEDLLKDQMKKDARVLSLDAFQAKYTSEDNASFLRLLEKQNEQKRQKYAWTFDKERKTLLLEAPKDGTVSAGTPGWAYKAQSSLMYYPEGAALTFADVKASRGGAPTISHGSTRLESTSMSTGELLQPRKSDAQVSAAHDPKQAWRDMASATPALFPGGVAGSEMKVQGYSFVAATPSPAPHKDVDPEELMTWGMIEGTPLLLDSGADHGGSRSFQLPPTPRRDMIGMKLAEKASKNIIKRQGGGSVSKHRGSTTPKPVHGVSSGSGSATPSLSPATQRGRMMSPAAQHLLRKTQINRTGLSGGSASSPWTQPRPDGLGATRAGSPFDTKHTGGTRPAGGSRF